MLIINSYQIKVLRENSVTTMDLMHRATPCISLFDVDGDKATLGLRWSEYLDGFEIYVIAMGINDPNRQKCLLLHLGGQGLQRLA